MKRYPAKPCEHEYPHIGHKVYSPSGITRCPGVKIPRGARHQSPGTRRVILTALRGITRYAHVMINDWDIDGTVRERAGRKERPRRVAEYPENNVTAWRELRADCDVLIGQLSQLREIADEAAQFVAGRERMAERSP